VFFQNANHQQLKIFNLQSCGNQKKGFDHHPMIKPFRMATETFLIINDSCFLLLATKFVVIVDYK
jgi:hypothetical protein